jgi:hypothetical protein
MEKGEDKMKEKFLPIGTVVLLKEGTKRLMITGYCMAAPENPNTIFDYAGCLFPEGFILDQKVALFNHGEIEKIDHLGLEDEEQKEFIKKLKEIIEEQINK